MAPPPRKRVCLQRDSSDSASGDAISSSSDEDDEEKPTEELEEEDPDPTLLADALDLDFTFQSVNPGTFVAVAYEDGYYVGEVEAKITPDTADVNFMCNCAGKKTLYKYQAPPENQHVHEKFVIAANFEMQTTNGRFWTMTTAVSQEIMTKFKAFKGLFFDQNLL